MQVHTALVTKGGRGDQTAIGYNYYQIKLVLIILYYLCEHIFGTFSELCLSHLRVSLLYSYKNE